MAESEKKAPALHVAGLKKTYQKKGSPVTEALKGVDLTIESGEFFALLGPNGAGKTSLIGILAGLVAKSAGTVEVNGISIDTDPDTAKSFIGLVPQEFNFSIFEKVEDIVMDQAGYYGISRAEARPVCDQLLKDLGLWEKRQAKAQSLSGGMKRRLLIARALIHKPSILLLDEPTAGVDVELRRGMWEFLQKLSGSGVTIILTTHYLEEAEQLAKRVAIITKGQIIEQGTVKELLSKLNYVTLILDTKEPVKDAALHLLEDMGVKRIDEMTLEFNLSPGQTVNDAIRRFASTGIDIMNVRNAGSRLEEIFMNVIEKHK
ncbi:MAG: ABC-2 type transport system ATP-binding protein [Parcubacteria bacterium C7867-001]|nr:MAG: ABC-2 type transport system ATP-binding protein [Parcubacteria bacterium C7867-001]